jgi:hypothetical protein
MTLIHSHETIVIFDSRDLLSNLARLLLFNPSHTVLMALSRSKTSQNKEEIQLLKISEIALSEVMLLSQLSPPPVPLKEFCVRAENINLSGVCK